MFKSFQFFFGFLGFNSLVALGAASSFAYQPCSSDNTLATAQTPVVCSVTFYYGGKCSSADEVKYTIKSGTCTTNLPQAPSSYQGCTQFNGAGNAYCNQNGTSTPAPTPKPGFNDDTPPKPTATATPKPVVTPSPTPKLVSTPSPTPKPVVTPSPTPKPVATATPPPGNVGQANPPALPDLIPTGLLQTSTTTVALQFQNNGSNSIGNYSIRLDVPALGTTYTSTATNTIPASGKTGQSVDILKKLLKLDSCIPGEIITVNATVDSSNSVRESNESNNQAQFKFQCPVAAASCTNSCPKGLIFNSVIAACDCPAGYTWDSTKLQCTKNSAVSCGCPTGFTSTPDGSQCQKMTSVAFAKAPVTAPMVKGDTNASYFENAVLIDNGTKALPNFGSDVQFNVVNAQGSGTPKVNGVAASTTNVIHSNSASYPYWAKQIIGTPSTTDSYGNSPLAVKIGYGTSQDFSDSRLGTYTKSVCINNTVSRNYVMHVGGDNSWQLRIDGVPYAACADINSGSCFQTSAFINQFIPSGKHLIELQYTNVSHFAAIWFQLLANKLDDVKTAGVTGAQPIDSSLFSTGNTKNITTWDYEGTSPCPAGYAFDSCSDTKMCTKIEHTACTK